MLNKEIKDFYKYFYVVLEHPFQHKSEQKIDEEELDLSLDFLEEVLGAEVSEVRLQELESRFNSAFENYINLPRTQIGALCNSIEKLASLLDPFLKKLTYKFYPQKFLKKRNKSIPLWWTSDFADILEELKISECDLKCSEENFWIQQSCDQAILRVAFVTRHKGVHESHRYTLQELERIAYGAIGSYLVICMTVMRDPSVRVVFKEKIEQRRFVTLLKGKTEAFDTTGSLLSENEHLSLYKYRLNIDPTPKEARFIFINYLASRGPAFFWLKKYSKSEKIKWARECLKVQDELIRRNAIRYLIENGQIFPLGDIVNLFKDYELKVELADYIRRFSRKEDVSLLLRLCRDNAEEVSEAACDSLRQLVSKEDNPVLHKLALSNSEYNQYLLRSIIKKIASKRRIRHYRKFATIISKPAQLIALYCLGETGEKQDMNLVKDWLHLRRRNVNLRYAGWYAISRIASHIKDNSLVVKLIKRRNKDSCVAALEAITREGIGPNFNYLFACRKVSKEALHEVISQIAKREDLDIIKYNLKRVNLDNDTRELVLAICKYGGQDEFDFLLDLFCKYPHKIEFWNHVKVASEMSKLCNRRALSNLQRMMSSPEFWKYFGRKRAKANPMPVRNFENLPLLKRIISAAFCKIAEKKETFLLRELLKHDYKWISLNASLSLAQLSEEKELDWLVQEALPYKEDGNQEYIIKALCYLDKKIYGQ